MALAAQKLKPARSYQAGNTIQAIRARIKQGTPDGTKGQFSIKTAVSWCIGVFPKGSFVLPAAKHVITAFDGTTPAIDVGTATVPAGFIASASIAPASIAFAGNLSGANMGFQTDDTPVYVTLTCANNTVGELDILLPFYVPQD